MTWEEAVEQSEADIAVRAEKCKPPKPNVVMKGPLGSNYIAWNRSTQPWTRCTFAAAEELDDWRPSKTNRQAAATLVPDAPSVRPPPRRQ